MKKLYLLEDFLRITSKIDVKATYELEENLTLLISNLASDNLDAAKKIKFIKQFNVYLKKKTEELDPSFKESEIFNLRKIRSMMVHRNISVSDVKVMSPLLWKSIKKLSKYVGAYEIENQLAYSLRIDNYHLYKNGFTTTKIVNWYKDYYDSLDDEYKRMIFSDLLLRIFSDKELLNYLDAENEDSIS